MKTSTPGAKAQTRAAGGAKNVAPNAIARLKQDHAAVGKLFRQYEKSKEEMSDGEKGFLAARICGELTVHAQIEEEIFYPAAKTLEDGVDGLPELLDEAEVEHAGAKDLIAQIQAMTPGESLFDAKVKVLGEYIKHHVKEEEEELFPKISKSRKLDLEALGAELDERSRQLKDELRLD